MTIPEVGGRMDPPEEGIFARGYSSDGLPSRLEGGARQIRETDSMGSLFSLVYDYNSDGRSVDGSGLSVGDVRRSRDSSLDRYSRSVPNSHRSLPSFQSQRSCLSLSNQSGRSVPSSHSSQHAPPMPSMSLNPSSETSRAPRARSATGGYFSNANTGSSGARAKDATYASTLFPEALSTVEEENNGTNRLRPRSFLNTILTANQTATSNGNNSHTGPASNSNSTHTRSASGGGPSQAPEDPFGLRITPLTPPFTVSKFGAPLCGALLDDKYLLIGTTTGLCFIPLRKDAPPAVSPIVIVKKTRFKQITVLEEHSQTLVALAGKSSHVRVYPLSGIRAIIAKKMSILNAPPKPSMSSNARKRMSGWMSKISGTAGSSTGPGTGQTATRSPKDSPTNSPPAGMTALPKPSGLSLLQPRSSYAKPESTRDLADFLRSNQATSSTSLQAPTQYVPLLPGGTSSYSVSPALSQYTFPGAPSTSSSSIGSPVGSPHMRQASLQAVDGDATAVPSTSGTTAPAMAASRSGDSARLLPRNAGRRPAGITSSSTDESSTHPGDGEALLSFTEALTQTEPAIMDEPESSLTPNMDAPQRGKAAWGTSAPSEPARSNTSLSLHPPGHPTLHMWSDDPLLFSADSSYVPYTKLTITKNTTMYRAVVTKKHTFVVVQCEDRLEIFHGTPRSPFRQNRTFILPYVPISLELRLQGEDMVEIYLLYQDGIFALDPSTIEVREVRVDPHPSEAPRLTEAEILAGNFTIPVVQHPGHSRPAHLQENEVQNRAYNGNEAQEGTTGRLRHYIRNSIMAQNGGNSAFGYDEEEEETAQEVMRDRSADGRTIPEDIAEGSGVRVTYPPSFASNRATRVSHSGRSRMASSEGSRNRDAESDGMTRPSADYSSPSSDDEEVVSENANSTHSERTFSLRFGIRSAARNPPPVPPLPEEDDSSSEDEREPSYYSGLQQLPFLPEFPSNLLYGSWTIPPLYSAVVKNDVPRLKTISLLIPPPGVRNRRPGLFFVTRDDRYTNLITSEGRLILQLPVIWEFPRPGVLYNPRNVMPSGGRVEIITTHNDIVLLYISEMTKHLYGLSTNLAAICAEDEPVKTKPPLGYPVNLLEHKRKSRSRNGLTSRAVKFLDAKNNNVFFSDTVDGQEIVIYSCTAAEGQPTGPTD